MERSLVDASFASKQQIGLIILPKLKALAKAKQANEGRKWLVKKSKARKYLPTDGVELAKVQILSKKGSGAQPRMSFLRLFDGGDVHNEFSYSRNSTAHEMTCMYCASNAIHAPYGKECKGLCGPHFIENGGVEQ
jgi:hypothetical protein